MNAAEAGCGQCLPCRINRRRLWTSRLMLESYLHQASVFLTLTYRNECLPVDGSVDVREVQLFLKRLRERLGDVKIRFFAIGEYGDRYLRPHYHLLVFGVGASNHVNAHYVGRKRNYCAGCVFCSSWSRGEVHVGTVTENSVMYCTGYITKGMTRDGDLRLKGRRPEFCRMSLRPGIGAGAVTELARVLQGAASKKVYETGDVPHEIRMLGKKWPLGRYVRQLLRERLWDSRKEPPRGAMVRQVAFLKVLKDEVELDRRRRMSIQSVKRAEFKEQVRNLRRIQGETA